MSYSAGQVSVWNGVGWEQAVEPFWAPSPGSVSSYGTGLVINYPGTAHTMSSWVEIIGSANAGKAIGFGLANSLSAQNTATLIEIAKGTAGGETTILGPVPVGSWILQSSISGRNALFFPFEVADGDRISARIQGQKTSGSVTIYTPITVDAPNTTTATALDVIGTDSATSKGVALSQTADVYVEIIGSAAATYGALIAVVSAGTTTMQTRSGAITIATGAAGSEVDLFSRSYASDTAERIWFNNSQGTTFNNLVHYATGSAVTTGPTGYISNNIWPVFIPQGTRIAAKASFGTASADIAIIGVRP